MLSIQNEMLIGCMYQGGMEVKATNKLWGVYERWGKQFGVVCEEFLGRLLQGVRGKVYWKWGNCQLSWSKTSWNNELKLDSWKEKNLHGQFYEQYHEQHMYENLELVTKSRLEDTKRSTYLCRSGTGSQDQPCNWYYVHCKTVRVPLM